MDEYRELAKRLGKPRYVTDPKSIYEDRLKAADAIEALVRRVEEQQETITEQALQLLAYYDQELGLI